MEGKKVYVATPMYGGLATAGYITSMLRLQTLCGEVGVGMDTGFLYNESLITRGRNKLVSMFLASSSTHLLFIDADIEFDPQDVLSMLRLNLDVVAGGYSKKSINWSRVAKAATSGLADPRHLALVASAPCFNLNRSSVDVNEPVEVPEVGTGFLMIRRGVLEAIQRANPDDFYMDDVDGSGDKIYRFFDCAVRDGRYLSEDFYFTRRWADLGGKNYLCPWMKTVHYGTYGFELNLHAIAQLGLPL